MIKINIQDTVEKLIDTFLNAGRISLELRKEGLTKHIKDDNTPVNKGDLEVNKIITNEIKKLTPANHIVSEEKEENKTIKNIKE